MKNLMSVILAVAALLIAGSAQAADRNWDFGSVWAISYAETKPGKFNDYMNDLNNVWRKFLEDEKATGDVLSYRVLQAAFPRDGEPDVIFLVEYKNYAAFDKGMEYFENQSKEIMGSVDEAMQAGIDREAIRALRGSLVAQEIMLR
ncbi:MAG: hypothetical protein ACR2QV_00920 [Gammaproteobacteria bacterium]